MEQESKDKEPIDMSVLQIVLEEFSERQAEGNEQLAKLLEEVSALDSRIKEIGEQTKDKLKETTDYTPLILNTIEKRLKQQHSNRVDKPQKEVKEFRFLLFPEQDRKLFYKIVFGRWLLYLVIMLLLNNIYRFALHYNDNQKQLLLEQIEHDRIRKSWNHMYKSSSKNVRQIMDKAYNNSGESEDK